MATAMIEVENLTFDYPGFRALDNLNVRIEAGSVTALVGPNGAGKTTLLRCLAALDTPASGTVRVDGNDLYETPRAVHRVMGYVSDNFGLYGDLKVVQGLEYAARAKGMDGVDIAAAVQATARQMGLQDKLQQPAYSLSRGQRQRMAIGQSIIHSPKVLLLDEPASGLDPEARGALAHVFKDLQARGMTLLVSSHILAELDAYSTHMLSIHDGKVLEHRALEHVGMAGAPVSRHLRLEFMDSADGARSWLQGQAHVQLKPSSGAVSLVDIAFDAGAAEQAALLAACVAAGHSLLSLSQVQENLQDSYLQSLQARRSRDAVNGGAA